MGILQEAVQGKYMVYQQGQQQQQLTHRARGLLRTQRCGVDCCCCGVDRARRQVASGQRAAAQHARRLCGGEQLHPRVGRKSEAGRQAIRKELWAGGKVGLQK